MWMPCARSHFPIGAFGPYNATSMTPVTSVGMANGMSTTVDRARRPQNRYRVRT